jgi:hypothetical protein
MANITKTTADAFIPEIWANRALEVLRANIVLAKLVTKDTDIATFQMGDVLHVPYAGTFVANDKAANAAVTLQTPTGGADLSMTLNKHKEVSFLIEDPARAQANQDLMDRYINSAVSAIEQAIESDLFALYSSLSGSVGTSGTDITAATIRSARKALNDNKVPLSPRHLVISSKDEIALLGDSNLATYFANSRPETIAQGALGELYGFTLWMSQLVPVVTGTPNSTKNLAFHPEFAILAMRALPEPPAGAGARAVAMRDPVSGLVIRVTSAYNPTYLGVQVTMDVLYGVAKLRDAAGIVVLS